MVYVIVPYVGEHALLVEQAEDADGTPQEQVQDVLVVDELDLPPVDALPRVLLLLHDEDVLQTETLYG